MTATKISPALKQLLNTNAHPPSLQSSAFHHQLKRLLADFHQTASEKKLTSDSWTIFSTAALVSLNRPSAFEPFWASLKSTTSSNEKASVYNASLVRETALKSISFIGIAKSINALNTFRAVLEKSNSDLLPQLDQQKPRRIPDLNENSIEKISQRALGTWKSIYRPLDDKLISKLSAAHPDLPVHILHSHYGPLLSDPASDPGPIGRIGTSLIAVGTLRAAGNLGPQLLSHVYGLKKAGEELQQVGEPSLGQGTQWLTSDTGAEWIINSIDRLSQLISDSEAHPTPTSKI
ncbi:hypothetical protein PGT21_010227 [Puccinia graminis f. sp. tritici]|uniref:Dol-P-Man:Man(5)GlcNAc(2)-PP-Dol alpha-1,3-mannosyltransferase n=2 Tax=Puccinia graminis f. sp. tritici TaxID=56615 RepID=E3KS85_PUCGT|nr:uncharacterized protein PGTG_13379 [Puccinia graminis f. sp. tritici CRL 75-36-700-3]EFP87160.1 hypothetical protein PGTG_13379 [Puccinia graminis f. sp. tritici CRL 75-36-700-3]KAA1073373.1 hypothetical protein PGT21_010227 [Puccinia graminis f. sp. tritici]